MEFGTTPAGWGSDMGNLDWICLWGMTEPQAGKSVGLM